MPVFRFPTFDALRLALVSGVVPPEVAARPLTAGYDSTWQLWIAPSLLIPPDTVAALTRLGVSAFGRSGLDGNPAVDSYSTWAELLPLRPAQTSAGNQLQAIEVPAQHLARIAAWLTRSGPAPLAMGLTSESGWVVVNSLPMAIRLAVTDLGGTIYTQRRPLVWIESGYEHPVESQIQPDTPIVLPARGRWRAGPKLESPAACSLMAGPQPATAELVPNCSVWLKLVNNPSETVASCAWMTPNPGPAGLAAWFAATGQAALAPLRLAQVSHGSMNWLVVVGPRGANVLPPAAQWSTAFSVYTGLPNLLIPAQQRLRPIVRPDTLARVLNLPMDTLGLLTETTSGLTLFRIPRAAFCRAESCLRYTAPLPLRLEPAADLGELGLPRFVAEADPPPPARGPDKTKPRSSPPARLGFLQRLWSRGPVPKTRRTPPPAPPAEPAPSLPAHTLGVLSNARVNTLQNESTARRSYLEQRILQDLPRVDAARRAELWSDLGDVYAAIGNFPDAALAFLNAAWYSPANAKIVVRNWLVAEKKAARLAPNAPLEFHGPSAGRLVCAMLAEAVLVGPNPELSSRLAESIRILDATPDLPVRAAWLGWSAAARLCGDDTLLLARARDRLFDRLSESGPGLDVDTPSFLRFRGIAGDRYRTARDWMIRVREPIHRWLGKLNTSGGLQWAGLDGGLNGTSAYADLLLAWGLAKLGDRNRAANLEARAAEMLTSISPPGADPAVANLLLAAFRDRIRSAREGRPDAPGLPGELRAAHDTLDDLGRYAVDKLRASLGILEPIELPNPYAGRDVATFLGVDALGERLTKFLAGRPALSRPEDARHLLTLDQSDPIAATMPRIIYTLLETAPHLDLHIIAAVIPQTVSAIDLIPAWLRLSAADADPNAVTLRIGRRMLEAACHAASLYGVTDSFRHMTEDVLERCTDPASLMPRMVEPLAGRYFRTLSKLKLKPLAEVLLTRLRPGTAATERELGLAVGMLLTGDDESGNRVLDAVRERLLVRGVSDDDDRTRLAIGYAQALAHAPSRVALGRLEELFLRLDMVSVMGAANRYYTLPPLRLIDTAIRAVVGDDFVIGPGVRGWLAAEEFSIRSRIARDLAVALAVGR